jgi:hypothetical protein
VGANVDADASLVMERCVVGVSGDGVAIATLADTVLDAVWCALVLIGTRNYLYRVARLPCLTLLLSCRSASCCGR